MPTPKFAANLGIFRPYTKNKTKPSLSNGSQPFQNYDDDDDDEKRRAGNLEMNEWRSHETRSAEHGDDCPLLVLSCNLQLSTS